MSKYQAQKSPVQDRAFDFLVAGAGLPSPLRGSVMSAGYASLGMNLLRRTQPCTRVGENKKGPRKEGLFLFLVAGARFALLRKPENEFD